YASANQGPQTSSALANRFCSAKTLSVAGILLVSSENLGPDIVTPCRWDMPLSVFAEQNRLAKALLVCGP
ncbi:hypothetical protein ACCS33_37400, partial [Rhizobium ruizarguesonis]